MGSVEHSHIVSIQKKIKVELLAGGIISKNRSRIFFHLKLFKNFLNENCSRKIRFMHAFKIKMHT
jgi:hypothetical protein